MSATHLLLVCLPPDFLSSEILWENVLVFSVRVSFSPLGISHLSSVYQVSYLQAGCLPLPSSNPGLCSIPEDLHHLPALASIFLFS